MFNFIKKFLTFFFSGLILAISFLVLFDAYRGGILFQKIKQNIADAPAEKIAPITFENPQVRRYVWNYDGNDYSISVTLFATAYEYYRKQPKVYHYDPDNLPENWENDYFGMFLKVADGDNTFAELAAQIKNEGLKKKLSEDQIAELALAFAQAIPYDDHRASVVLSAAQDSNEEDHLPKYPYETLYDLKGICSDKSFLTAILLRELGYGVSLFEYPDAKHMAVGVQCPLAYSTENTGFCYAETTTPGHRIGIVPRLDASGGKAIKREEISYFEESKNGSLDGVLLENVRVYQNLPGKSYQEIINISRLQQELARLEKYFPGKSGELKNLKAEIDLIEQELKDLKKKMDRLEDDEKYEKYNDLVPRYNNLVEKYKKKVKNYNAQIAEYNKNVATYNKLIKEYSIID